MRFDIVGAPGLDERNDLPKTSPTDLAEMLACEGRVRAKRFAKRFRVTKKSAGLAVDAGNAAHAAHHRNVVMMEKVRRMRTQKQGS